jgi:hypothetical protein
MLHNGEFCNGCIQNEFKTYKVSPQNNTNICRRYQNIGFLLFSFFIIEHLLLEIYLHIPTIGLPILLLENMWADPGNNKCGNWD